MIRAGPCALGASLHIEGGGAPLVPGASLPETVRPLSRFKIDLSGEARRFFRERIRVAGTGLGLGLAFIAIGLFEVGVLAPRGPTVDYGIALLLIVLGAGVSFISVYSGLINPVTGMRGNAAGIVFERRWGRTILWEWTDPELQIDIDDRSADSTASEKERGRLFFEGPGGVYGNLTPATLAPVLNTARTYGAAVSDKILEQRDRKGVHSLRRIRVRPRPIR